MRTTAGTADTSSYPTPAVSVARMFYDRVAATPEAEAFRFPTNGGWASVSWRQTAETVKATAAGLLALGIQPEERVAIASATRIEWLYADLAIMCAGAATTAVYPSTGGEDVAFILSDSGSRIVFAEDDTQIAKLRAQRDHMPDVLRVVTFDGEADGEWVLSLQDLQALGAKHLVENPTAVDEAVAAVQPEQLATLIYTSGTTGRPKGVELPHRCWTYIGAGAEAIDIVSPSDLQYLWLPMSHSFGKMLEAVQLADRLPHGRRRPHGQDRGEPRGGPADVHGGAPADLREGAREGRADHPGRGWDQIPVVHLGLRRGQQGLPGPAPGPPTEPGGPGPVRAGRPVGAVEDPRPAGRPDPLPRLGQRHPLEGRRRLVRRRRDACARGLRTDRDQRRGPASSAPRTRR